MGQFDYTLCFEEALRKAFAADSPEVREAYLDLASFYHGKLPNDGLPGFEDAVRRDPGPGGPGGNPA